MIRRDLVIGVASVVVLLATIGASAALAAPCDHETAYSCAIVSERLDRPTARSLILDTFVNSVVDLDDPTYLALRYSRAVDAVVSEATDGPFAAIYVGGGGYTLPRYYQATRGSTAVVLELDGELPGIAAEELGLEEGPWLESIVGDARMGILGLPDDSFELVVGDAFSGRSVPWHLTTVEFLGDIDDRLTADGLYVINVIDHPPLRFVQSQLLTMAEVFDEVAVVAPPDYLEGVRGGNFILVGTNGTVDWGAVSPVLTDGEVVRSGDEARSWAAAGIVLTDAFAPTDQLLSRP